jgi:hypothetical protein
LKREFSPTHRPSIRLLQSENKVIVATCWWCSPLPSVSRKKLNTSDSEWFVSFEWIPIFYGASALSVAHAILKMTVTSRKGVKGLARYE